MKANPNQRAESRSAFSIICREDLSTCVFPFHSNLLNIFLSTVALEASRNSRNDEIAEC